MREKSTIFLRKVVESPSSVDLFFASLSTINATTRHEREESKFQIPLALEREIETTSCNVPKPRTSTILSNYIID